LFLKLPIWPKLRAMAARAKYHHGSLRAALLEAALALLEADGLAQLSLRKLAGKLGVSHAAPAAHFPTFGHLLTALATIGFQRFDAAMKKARARASSDPAAQMRAGAAGYLEFASTNPALFRLMFTANMLDWSDAGLQAAARASREQLSALCAPAAAKRGLRSAAQRLELEQLVWSQIHGQAHLSIDRKIGDAACDSKPGKRRTKLDLTDLLFG
jgi:AcrR family transcriptional regulator